MVPLAQALPNAFERLAPDLPGFGASEHRQEDYSIRAHAAALSTWLRVLDRPPVHLVVHSMGGGVALELADRHPDQVASITMISAIGVQELELLGDQRVNHAIHLAQLWAIEAGSLLLPHFGLLDRSGLDRSYARNFSDTDQRPLRNILLRYQGPMLIVHGVDDPLVPVAAAREHHRLVPQSEYLELHTDHFLDFRPEEVGPLADEVADFIDRVEAGSARVRATADLSRIASAVLPFDPRQIPPVSGPGLLVTGLLLALATLVSEDLSCIVAGMLVAQGRMGFLAASISCGLGIFVGDLLLVLAGRLLGRAALRIPPLSWWVSEAAVDRAGAWYRRNGARVIFTSRFTPGARLPMYVAAGLLETPLLRFALLFGLAAALWTPLLVGVSTFAGEQLLDWLDAAQFGIWTLLGLVLALVLLSRTLVPLFTWRGRRLALGWWRRQLRWEFWSISRVYPLILPRLLRAAWRHGSPTVFTAANPGMPEGGFVGESKWEIHQRLGGRAPFLPRTLHLPATAPLEARLDAARAFMEAEGLDFPMVLKPDAGQRGQGVVVAHGPEALRTWLAAARIDGLLQEHIGGHEFGVFYLRRPGAPRGEISSITDKRLISVTGDGRRTLEELILSDDRAVCMGALHLRVHADHLATVPAADEEIRLVSVGTHSRGALFLDGGALFSPALLDAVEKIVDSFEGGFAFGRMDLRVPSPGSLTRGEDLKLIELNGVSSEPTHMYDPKHALGEGLQILAWHWEQAFAIGAAQAAAGARVATPGDLVRAWWRFRREQEAGHPKTS